MLSLAIYQLWDCVSNLQVQLYSLRMWYVQSLAEFLILFFFCLKEQKVPSIGQTFFV